MEIEIYSGKIEKLNEKSPYSPKGFVSMMEILEGNDWVTEKSESESSFYINGELSYLNKRTTQGVEIFYCFEGKNNFEKFSGLVRFVLSSDNPEKLTEIEKSIKKHIRDIEFLKT